jgi:ABC-type hemin transport system substrate-binding protein
VILASIAANTGFSADGILAMHPDEVLFWTSALTAYQRAVNSP